MAHPQMFEDDDPLLARVREIALALPGAAMKVSHGRPAFFTQKVFAYFGGSERIDGAWVQHARCVLVLPDAEERAALLDDERVYVPAYLGPSGWIGVELPHTKVKGWDEIAELVESSYRATAPRKLLAELDARGWVTAADARPAPAPGRRPAGGAGRPARRPSRSRSG